MIRNQLISLLSRFGATPFESVGGSFDPELQEAVANIPDARAEGEVIEELQRVIAFMTGSFVLLAWSLAPEIRVEKTKDFLRAGIIHKSRA